MRILRRAAALAITLGFLAGAGAAPVPSLPLRLDDV